MNSRVVPEWGYVKISIEYNGWTVDHMWGAWFASHDLPDGGFVSNPLTFEEALKMAGT